MPEGRTEAERGILQVGERLERRRRKGGGLKFGNGGGGFNHTGKRWGGGGGTMLEHVRVVGGPGKGENGGA